MSITVRRELYEKSPDEKTTETRSQRYLNGTGLIRLESRTLQSESDWSDAAFERVSDDNGRTWGEWRDVYRRGHERRGDDEITTSFRSGNYNRRHAHEVSLGMRRIFFGGHKQAYARYWGRGEAGLVDHSLLAVRPDGADDPVVELIKYEDGADYDPANPCNPAYTDFNRAYKGNAVDILDSGDIVFAIAPAVRACCRILGLNLNDVFPSCPDIMNGMIIARGTFNEDRGHYDLSFSRPVVISDLKSSRGVCEPEAVMLPSGRILAIFRGSNVENRKWNTRIEPGTPAHPWYCWSDDGGQTFTDPAPWHFDDRDVCYSAATISKFVKSIRNGRLYWIGNLSDHTAYGNNPRYPLVIVEVNDRGLPVKETLATLDTRCEDDGPGLQLSNFSILQDRETGMMELYLSKIGQRESALWWADAWRYFIEVPAEPPARRSGS